MERYSSRTIDEMGRLSLHSEIRKVLGLETGDKISLKLIGTIVILRRAESDSEKDCVVCQVSDIGMINLPVEIRQALGWKEKDKIAVYCVDNIVILKSARESNH